MRQRCEQDLNSWNLFKPKFEKNTFLVKAEAEQSSLHLNAPLEGLSFLIEHVMFAAAPVAAY